MKYPHSRTNSATVAVVNQGIEWRATYGSRSAAAFLAHRAIPRSVIERVLHTGDIRRAKKVQREPRAAVGTNNQSNQA